MDSHLTPSQKGFDSILVRLKAPQQHTRRIRRLRFDSILVRLKGLPPALVGYGLWTGFDSILVRLKEETQAA